MPRRPLDLHRGRHTGDAHYGTGTNHSDGIYEQGGFAVHFFDGALVDALAEGWTLNEVHPLEEGELPRKLWRIDQVKVREQSKLDGVHLPTYRAVSPI